MNTYFSVKQRRLLSHLDQVKTVGQAAFRHLAFLRPRFRRIENEIHLKILPDARCDELEQLLIALVKDLITL